MRPDIWIWKASAILDQPCWIFIQLDVDVPARIFFLKKNTFFLQKKHTPLHIEWSACYVMVPWSEKYSVRALTPSPSSTHVLQTCLMLTTYKHNQILDPSNLTIPRDDKTKSLLRKCQDSILFPMFYHAWPCLLKSDIKG